MVARSRTRVRVARRTYDSFLRRTHWTGVYGISSCSKLFAHDDHYLVLINI